MQRLLCITVKGRIARKQNKGGTEMNFEKHIKTILFNNAVRLIATDAFEGAADFIDVLCAS